MRKKNIFLIILTLGLILYSSAFFNEFVWDDEDQIVNNLPVHSIVNLPHFFMGGTFYSGGAEKLSGIYYKPMMMSVFSFLYTMFGNKPFFFHIFQIMCHILNSCMLYLLLHRLFGYVKRNMITKIAALSGAVFFLIHPIQTESVVYIAALQETLFLFFGLLSLLILTDKKSKNRTAALSLAGFFALASLLSKETGALFIVISAVYLLFFKKEDFIRYVIVSSIAVSLYFILRFGLAEVAVSGHGLSAISRASSAERLFTMPKIFIHYLLTFVFPKDLSTAQYWIVKNPTLKDFYAPLFFMIFVILASLYFVGSAGRYRKVLLFFLIWFYAGMTLHLQIIALDMTVAERWFYFPMAGLLGILGVLGILAVEKISGSSENYSKILKRSFVITFSIVFTLLCIRTYLRISNWRDGYSLYSHDIKVSPESFDLNNNLGVEYFRRGDKAMAEKYFRRSTELAPYWWTNWTNLGAVEAHKENWGKAEEYYKIAMKNSDYFLAYENYAGVLVRQKKFDEAIEFLEKKALPKFPKNQRLIKIYQYVKN